MKRVFLFLSLSGIIQAQSNLDWLNLSDGLYFNPKSQSGLVTNKASPGEYLATAFTYNLTSDYISGQCEQIYFKGSTVESMEFSKQIYSSYINAKDKAYDFVSFDLKNTKLVSRVLAGLALCNFGRPKNQTEIVNLDYKIAYFNKITIMRNLYYTKVKYSIDLENNASLEVVDAKPTP